MCRLRNRLTNRDVQAIDGFFPLQDTFEIVVFEGEEVGLLLHALDHVSEVGDLLFEGFDVVFFALAMFSSRLKGQVLSLLRGKGTGTYI